MLPLVLLLRLFTILVAIDADESKRLACQTLHERPLVFKHRAARGSPMPPEIEQHHFPAGVAEFEFLSVEVFSFDIRRRLTNGQVSDLEQLPVANVAQGLSARMLDVSIHLGYVLEKLFTLFLSPGASLV